MFHRLSSTISSRMVQFYQISNWHRPEMSASRANDCIAFRRYCPGIFAATTEAVGTLSTREVGTISSVLRKCVLTMAIFMIQEPTTAQISVFNPALRSYVLSRCPNFAISDSSLEEMESFIRTVMRLQCEADPRYARDSAELRRMQTYTDICAAFDLNRTITTRINLAMFHELLPQLHEKYGFKEMVAFTRAYRREDHHRNDRLPLPLLTPIEFSIDDTETEYQGVGRRVELANFCKPAKTVSKDAECPVCITEIDSNERGEDEQPVLTKCGHVFHKLCLDKWINDSGMKTSNTCPSCRAILCKPRRRLHASLGGAPIAGLYYEEEEVPGGSSAETSQVNGGVYPTWPLHWPF
ncbi:hypothetical protein EKO04_001954 [Ascochyta lentis]|uniref:RING-type domain-containing protein n=1 Tax=Ascochyta lentis TaxID=205686 RepID=A0A8H7MLW9_9PLEO|nr:hypothetical protein EKO04_001954 [Ascochyta lentis]